MSDTNYPSDKKRDFQIIPRLEVRQNSPEWLRFLIYTISLLVGCVCAVLVMYWVGINPADLIQEISILLFSFLMFLILLEDMVLIILRLVYTS